MRDLAERLIAHEARMNQRSGADGPAAFHACEKLRPHLAALMGHGGFRALLSRALALSNPDVPWLRGLQVRPDGSLGALEDLRAQLAPEELTEGTVVLLTQLLELLRTFVGEGLTLGLVEEVWPKLRSRDAGPDNGGEK